MKAIAHSTSSLTLRQGLERYYSNNPHFVRNQHLQVGWVRVSWRDLHKHDMMHIVTGYDTALPEEMKLDGIFLTALTWRRPWYYYPRSFGLLFAVVWGALRGNSFGDVYYSPLKICQFYLEGAMEGLKYRKKIDGYVDPETLMHRELRSLRAEYGIRNAGTWDS